MRVGVAFVFVLLVSFVVAGSDISVSFDRVDSGEEVGNYEGASFGWYWIGLVFLVVVILVYFWKRLYCVDKR